jgi:23S rRNA pseudouridine1911/1915/1917 synthase
MAAVPNSFSSNKSKTREAVTKFETIKKFTNFSLVKVKLETGRTHQIRVHFFAINHPLVGDNLYFNKKKTSKNKKTILNRIFLVSDELSFTDLKGKKQKFKIDLPKNLQKIIDNLN